MSIVCIILVLVSCESSPSPVIKPPEQFESAFDGSIGQMKISGILKKSAYGICTVTLNSPETLKDLQIKRIGETVTLSVSGSTVSEELSFFPANNFIRAVTDALDGLKNTSELNVTQTEEYVKYFSDESGFYAIFNKPDGSLKSLVIERDGISLEFYDYENIE